ncbi:MAG: CoA pyrophosphatase [Alphaproteobacteria bacterium]|nr:CoA pyrophosphatase [Alphaproteobacteria bacterium]
MTIATARSEDDLRARLRDRLQDGVARKRGDFDLDPTWRETLAPQRVLKPAAVLIPIIERRAGLQVLFTRRADHLARHAGQVSFPGGRLNDDDGHAVEAALRETEEEVGLPRSFVEVRGELDRYETGTGFSIHPFVGLVREGFELRIDASEVAEAFEVPLAFLMDPENHQQQMTMWQGRERRYYAMTFGSHYIWGATAGILINLHERLYG